MPDDNNPPVLTAFEDVEAIVAIGKSSDSPRALSSSSLSKWATISSYDPFSSLAIFTDLFSLGMSFRPLGLILPRSLTVSLYLGQTKGGAIRVLLLLGTPV